MPTLFLIRHADPESPWRGRDSDRPLSDEGRGQARQAGLSLRGCGATELRSAPHRRCVETAELIGRELGLTPIVDPQLHISRRFDLACPAGVAIWVAHSNNIPGALHRAGFECHVCGLASIWRVDFDDSGSPAQTTYKEPA
jgi:hypothetical protein